MIHLPLWLSTLIILSLIGGLMTGVSTLQNRKAIHPELARKLVHIGMGLVTLSFPWVFQNPWQVVFIASLACLLMFGIKRLPLAKLRFGNAIHSVERTSFGEFFFPISVVLLFILSHGQPLMFCIPMLILTLGDAIAALIGVRYGLTRFNAEDGHKSFEGSFAFFTATFLCVHIPLLLFTSIGRPQCVLIAILLGILAMLLEAFSWSGLDNLFLPIGAFVMLEKLQMLSSGEIIERIIIIGLLVAFTAAWRNRTTLRHSALLGAAFGCYVSWTIGGLIWLIAPVSVLIAYTLLTPRSSESESRSHNMNSILSVSSVGFIWQFIDASFHIPILFYCYVLSYAIQLSMISVVRRSHDATDSQLPDGTLVWAVVKSWVVLFIPFYWLAANSHAYVLESGMAFLIMLIITALFYRNNITTVQRQTDREILWQQAFFTAAGSTLGVVFAIH